MAFVPTGYTISVFINKVLNANGNANGGTATQANDLLTASTSTALTTEQQKAAKVFYDNFAAANTNGDNQLDQSEIKTYGLAHKRSICRYQSVLLHGSGYTR
jgi:hypothetical protein